MVLHMTAHSTTNIARPTCLDRTIQESPFLKASTVFDVVTGVVRSMTGCASQGNDPGYMWAMTVLSFWLKLTIGILGACLTLLWLLQVLLYIFIYPPISPFLNEMFVRLDRVFPLFGTFAFALFCFYLIGESSQTCGLLQTIDLLLLT